jgi:hypothetical protein
MFGAMAVGKTEIFGLLEGEDVLDTAKAMRAFGAEVTQHGPGHWTVHGVGVGGLAEPDTVIDCGNSGTGVRLIMGMMATCPDHGDLHRGREFEQTSNGADYGSACVVWNADCWTLRWAIAPDHCWGAKPSVC